jgi:DNA-binding transcriptional MerR regulator
MSETVSLEQLLDAVSVPPHMINLWTKKFPIFSPKRNSEGKMSFNNRDVFFAKGLKHLLIHENENIKAVQAMLNEKGIAYIIDIGRNPQNYKSNHSNYNMRASFTGTELERNKLNLSGATREVAKKTFENINTIFNTEKKKYISKNNDKIPDKENTLDTINIEEKTEQPQTEISNVVISNFEENWRTLMEQKGKATPVEHVRDKKNIHHDDMINDIWFIDDEVNLFDDEVIDMTHLVPTVTQKAPKLPILNNISVITENASLTEGLTIEQIEKIKHLIAKLDIMRDEIASANRVITKTLKAFGYSSFENAYDKFDEKSVY